MAQNKSPISQLKDLRKQAGLYKNATIEIKAIKANVTEFKAAMCHFGNKYFLMAKEFQEDGDQGSLGAGITPKYYDSFKDNCKTDFDKVVTGQDDEGRVPGAETKTPPVDEDL